jgi:hypothetical protein
MYRWTEFTNDELVLEVQLDVEIIRHTVALILNPLAGTYRVPLLRTFNILFFVFRRY